MEKVYVRQNDCRGKTYSEMNLNAKIVTIVDGRTNEQTESRMPISNQLA